MVLKVQIRISLSIQFRKICSSEVHPYFIIIVSYAIFENDDFVQIELVKTNIYSNRTYLYDDFVYDL